jgi:hypothetical protein
VDNAEHGPVDEALARLEDVLLSLPFDRAVPELPWILQQAEVDRSLLARDERAWKLLHEALVARPFGDLEDVQRVRTEVQLLTLEVELLTERLADATTPPEEAGRVADRLREVHRRFAELRDQL